MIDTRLGPYEIVAPLGAGGTGEVCRARDTRLGREVAIEVLSTDRDLTDERRQRFLQEARAVSALEGRPAALSFWYRQSRTALRSQYFLHQGRVTPSDSPMTVPGMVTVRPTRRGA